VGCLNVGCGGTAESRGVGEPAIRIAKGGTETETATATATAWLVPVADPPIVRSRAAAMRR
jgi:hypothetical protein